MDSEFLTSCLFWPSATCSSEGTGSTGKGFPVIIRCLATAPHSLGICKGINQKRITLKKHSRRYLWGNPLPLKAVRFQLFSYREVDANGLILAMDFVSKIIEEAHNGGLLQRHGWTEARAHNSRPRQSNALPVMQVGQAHSAVVPQKAV